MRNVKPAAFWFMVCCLAISIGAMASEEAPVATPQQSQAAAQAAYQNQLICKTKTEVGSHIPKRTCKTRAQLDADADRAQRALQDVQAPHPVSGGEMAHPNG
jgi:hypothetical protein